MVLTFPASVVVLPVVVAGHVKIAADDLEDSWRPKSPKADANKTDGVTIRG
jgi:hypothetical protein